VLILLIANLAFAAWARFIDRPTDPPAARDISHLPQLVLASEAPGRAGAPGHRIPGPPGSAPAPAAPGQAQAGRPAGDQAMVAVAGRPGEAGLAAQAQAERCVSVGPFTEPANAAAAVLLLQGRGLAAQQRAQDARYWVDVHLQRSAEVPMDGLLQLQQSGAQLSVRDCPGPAASNAPVGRPAGTHAAARPG